MASDFNYPSRNKENGEDDEDSIELDIELMNLENAMELECNTLIKS